MKIAITQRVINFRNGPYDALDHGFYNMFNDHTLLPIPNDINHFKSNDIINSDLIVFSGGNSMITDDWQYSSERLRVEKHILELALAYKKPIIGISRGTQFLNVSLGGSIKKTDRHTTDHVVYYKDTTRKVCSRHSEYLDTIPPGVTVLARDAQGHCESWKLENIACVLWHPERMQDNWMPDEVESLFNF